MAEERRADDVEDDRHAIAACFENAAHSPAMEGLHLDRQKYPEIEAVIDGTIIFDVAAKAMVKCHSRA